MKRAIDEAIVKFVEEELGYPEDHYWSNAKLLIMFSATAIALFGQFYPCDPRTGDAQSRAIVIMCVVAYFVLSVLLQLVITFVDKDTIMITKTPAPMRIRTAMPPYSKMFEMKMSPKEETNDAACSSAKISVEKLFNDDGELLIAPLAKFVRAVAKDAKKAAN